MKRILSLLICVALLLGACKKDTAKKESNPQQIQSYSEAVAAVHTAQTLDYRVLQKKTTAIGNQAVEETRMQTINFREFGTDKMAAMVTETITVGEETIELTHNYYDGFGYTEIEGSCFCSPTDADTFMSQFAPPVLLTQDRYRKVETTVNNGITVFHFSDSSSSEEWATPANASVKQSHGDATIDENGKLIATTYHVSYTDGPASVRVETTVSLNYPESVEIAELDKSKFTEVESLSAPKLLETACLYLNNLQKITTTATSKMASDAFNIRRNQTTQANVSTAEPYTAKIDTLVTQQDYSTSDAATIEQSIVFENGVYSTTIDGVTETDSTVTQENMEGYIRNLMLGNIPSVDQLCAASAESVDGYTIIKLQVSEALSDLICQQVSNSLYGDPLFLFNISESVEESHPEFYFAINNQTGFPTACGYSFENNHTVDRTDYKITSYADQAFQIDTIQAAPATDSIDPPFYSVTDGTDKTLWILGTTQYGDSRSSSLPAHVYTALTQAETIVLEYSEISVSNNSLSEDNVSDELYAQAVPYLFVNGTYHSESNKNAVALNNSIHNHFVANGYRINQANSIHSSIYQFAVPSGKRIDILFPDNNPSQFCNTLSIDAQQLLLQNTLQNTPSLEQNAYLLLEALYQGNDAKLMELLRFDDYTDDPQLLDELTESLYVTPSEMIAQALAIYLEEGKNTFAVIDIRYMIFINNVLDNLREMGYTITRN